MRACRSPAASCSSDSHAREVPALADVRGQSTNHVGADATNTSVILDEALFLKAYRRAEAGLNPDVEMTSFLTRAGYRFDRAARGQRHARGAARARVLAAFFAAVGHQGDVWNYALNHLERYATTMFSTQDAASLGVRRTRSSPRRCTRSADASVNLHCVLAGADPGDQAFAHRAAEERGPVALVQRNSFRRRQLLRPLRERMPTLGERQAIAAAGSARARGAAAGAHSRALQRTGRGPEDAPSRQSASRQGAAGRRRFPAHGIRRQRVADDRERRIKDSPLRDVAAGAALVRLCARHRAGSASAWAAPICAIRWCRRWTNG